MKVALHYESRNPCWQGMPHEACEGSEPETTSGAQHHILTRRHKQLLLILPPSWEWEKKILQQESSQLLPSLGYTNHATLHPPTRAPRAWTHAWLMSPPGRQDWPVKSQCSVGLLVIDWCLFCFSTFRGGVPFIFECNLIIIYTFIMILIICFHAIYI